MRHLQALRLQALRLQALRLQALRLPALRLGLPFRQAHQDHQGHQVHLALMALQAPLDELLRRRSVRQERQGVLVREVRQGRQVHQDLIWCRVDAGPDRGFISIALTN